MKEGKAVVEEIKIEVKNEKYPDAKWYVVQTQSNTEKKAKNNLLENIKLKNAEDKIIEVFYPVVETIVMNAGKKRKSITKPFAGYIFILAIMDDEVFTIVKNTERVVGFPSKNATRPLPLRMTTKEMQNVIDSVRVYKEKEDFKLAVGATVRVSNVNLAFHEMIGKVKTCNVERNKVVMEITILGRETEVEIPLDSVELCSEEM